MLVLNVHSWPFGLYAQPELIMTNFNTLVYAELYTVHNGYYSSMFDLSGKPLWPNVIKYNWEIPNRHGDKSLQNSSSQTSITMEL